MKVNHAYHVKYRMHSADDVHGIDILAADKASAYDTATYEAIPAKEGSIPYSAWVHSVTYNNGNYRTFKTFEGNPY